MNSIKLLLDEHHTFFTQKAFHMHYESSVLNGKDVLKTKSYTNQHVNKSVKETP